MPMLSLLREVVRCFGKVLPSAAQTLMMYMTDTLRGRDSLPPALLMLMPVVTVVVFLSTFEPSLLSPGPSTPGVLASEMTFTE